MFESVIAPYQKEILTHCYQMMGSIVDAEDMLQETWLHAWKGLTHYQELGAFRAWLYRIATNICLDHLRKCKKRSLVPSSIPNSQDNSPTVDPLDETLWIEPFPSEMMPQAIDNPEALYSIRESVNLAFMTALYRLSARNWAFLLLRDVWGWRTREVAEFLELTETAVNSVLKRACKETKESGLKMRNEASSDLIDAHHSLRCRLSVGKFGHRWLQCTPAIAAGLTDHIWTADTIKCGVTCGQLL